MRRFASIDMMRGAAIWMMVIFHVIMRYYDMDWVKEGDLGNLSLGAMALMLVLMISLLVILFLIPLDVF